MKLIPREEKFLVLLGQLVSRIASGGRLFTDLLADYDQRLMYAERIKVVEEECDVLAAEILAKLDVSFITPIDREDIHLLATRSDDIIDAINGLARRLEISNAVVLRPDVPELAGLLARSLEELEAAFAQLQARNGVSAHSQAVRRLEKEADHRYAEALRRLFTEEPDAIEVIKWITIYELLEDAIDRCKHLAEVVEGIVVKHS